MADLAIERSAALACRLRHRVGRWGPSPTSGEIELENVSAVPVEIEVDRHPLQYLNVVVTDACGAVITDGYYGDVFSPLGETSTLRLAPGEKYAHNVSLIGTLREEKLRPGTYTVRAVYEYKGFRAVSEPLIVVLPENC